jgi:hypothetical protein
MAAEQAPACCGEWRCTRGQPIRVARSELTGMWYAVTAYAERANGGFESMQKHMLHPADAEQLEAAHQAAEHLAAIQRGELPRPVRVVELPQDMPAGVEPATPPEVPCRWCGEPLHLGRGGMYRGPDEKSVCVATTVPDGQYVHEPRAVVDG